MSSRPSAAFIYEALHAALEFYAGNGGLLPSGPVVYKHTYANGFEQYITIAEACSVSGRLIDEYRTAEINLWAAPKYVKDFLKREGILPS